MLSCSLAQVCFKCLHIPCFHMCEHLDIGICSVLELSLCIASQLKKRFKNDQIENTSKLRTNPLIVTPTNSVSYHKVRLGNPLAVFPNTQTYFM